MEERGTQEGRSRPLAAGCPKVTVCSMRRCACVSACARVMLMEALSWHWDPRGEEGPAKESRGGQRGHGEAEPDEVGILHVLELLEVVDADEVALGHNHQPAARMQEI